MSGAPLTSSGDSLRDRVLLAAAAVEAFKFVQADPVLRDECDGSVAAFTSAEVAFIVGASEAEVEAILEGLKSGGQAREWTP